MAAIKISNTVGAVHDAVAIQGLMEATYNIQALGKTFASDGGPEEFDVVDVAVQGTVNFDGIAAYNQALAGDESNLVITTRVKGGAATRVITLKNCRFSAGRGQLPVRQGTRGATFSADFRCQAGASDTAATMVTDAAGA